MGGWAMPSGRRSRMAACKSRPARGRTDEAAVRRHQQLHIEFKLPLSRPNAGRGGLTAAYTWRTCTRSRCWTRRTDAYVRRLRRPLQHRRAKVNACLPPEVWQTYTSRPAARWTTNGTVKELPRITVIHNGVKIHDEQESRWPATAPRGHPTPGPRPSHPVPNIWWWSKTVDVGCIATRLIAQPFRWFARGWRNRRPLSFRPEDRAAGRSGESGKGIGVPLQCGDDGSQSGQVPGMEKTELNEELGR